ncbi:MAG: GNAT family N-acetyltransferase [Pseudomonadota bacterium]
MTPEARHDITVVEEPHDGPDAQALQEALSAQLKAAYGSDGKAGFAGFTAGSDGSLFAVARDAAGLAVGCGALLPLAGEPGCGEVKRMYAARPGQGIGGRVLAFLEQQARAAGYRRLVLCTRHANTGALAFYRSQGFTDTPSYGPYAARPECACLAKLLG